MKSLLQRLLLLHCLVGATTAFAVHSQTPTRRPSRVNLSLAEGTTDHDSNRKRRVKRKTVEAIDDTPPQKNTNDFQPRRDDSSGVSFKVADIRDIVNGNNNSSPGQANSLASQNSSSSNNQLAPATAKTVSSSSISLDDSLQQLLLDARDMQDKEAPADENENATKLRNAISTLVTIDFFVVCLFLLWFLAGIVCSAVLKDDTVQIAFNSNFQQLVQPALGLLMVASVADAVFKQNDDEDESY